MESGTSRHGGGFVHVLTTIGFGFGRGSRCTLGASHHTAILIVGQRAGKAGPIFVLGISHQLCQLSKNAVQNEGLSAIRFALPHMAIDMNHSEPMNPVNST